MTLASYAMNPATTCGRLHLHVPRQLRREREAGPSSEASAQGDLSLIDPFCEDVFRIIRSTSFRRLANKTQVFINDEDKVDHYRSRLTHSIETAAVGRSIAKNLQLSADLTEAICLAHDLGHPPFGHAGEDVLDELLKRFGGFNHNYYAFKLITELEEKYLDYNGLNLTWEALEGIIKHNGPLVAGNYPAFVAEYDARHNLELGRMPSLEGQVASISDDIAYTSHDMEDALRDGLITLDELISQPFFGAVFGYPLNQTSCKGEFVAEVTMNLRGKYADDEKRIACEIMVAVTDFLIADVIAASKQRIEASGVASFADVQAQPEFLIDLSEQGRVVLTRAKAFMLERCYTNPRIVKIRNHYKQMIRDIFERLVADPSLLPERWQRKTQELGLELPVVVGDYIAGMTDKFIIGLHRGLV